MGDSKKSLALKWIGGIVASIISAITVWYITNEVKENSKKPDVIITKSPVLKITAVNFDQPLRMPAIWYDFTATARITITNLGNDFAQNCQGKWEWTGEPITVPLTQPDEFVLAPNESRTITIEIPFLRKAGQYEFIVTVTCANGISAILTRNANVFSANGFDGKGDSLTVDQ